MAIVTPFVRVGTSFVLDFSKDQTISSSTFFVETACSRYGVTRTSLGIAVELALMVP